MGKVNSQNYIDLGFGNGKKPPKPVKCEFCGNPLHFKAVVIGGAIFTWIQEPERCNCEKAIAKWRRYDAEQERLKAEDELAKKRDAFNKRVQKIIGKSGMKRRFLERRFDNFDILSPKHKKWFDAAKNYADNFQTFANKGEGLYIEGSNGTGKTHLSAAIANDLLHKGIPVICETAGELLLGIKDTFDAAGKSEKEVLEVFKNVDLLIIDDLGKEQCTDWSVSTLFTILNYRYEDLRPTIISTNYNVDDLIQAITPPRCDSQKAKAIISRLREVSHAISMFGDDYRIVRP